MADNQHPMDQLQAILRRREPLYAIADHTIDTSSIGNSTSIQTSVDLYDQQH
jgi:hypothetical protein